MKRAAKTLPEGSRARGPREAPKGTGRPKRKIGAMGKFIRHAREGAGVSRRSANTAWRSCRFVLIDSGNDVSPADRGSQVVLEQWHRGGRWSSRNRHDPPHA